MADRARDPAPDPKSPTRSHTPSPLRQTGSLFDWLFRNRQTRQMAIAQFPDVPLWIFLLTVVLRWVVPTGSAACTVLECTVLAALVWWALDEVFRGVNPWRRLLGLGGCVFVAAGLAWLLRERAPIGPELRERDRLRPSFHLVDLQERPTPATHPHCPAHLLARALS